jgi:hypothetical protein
MVEAKLKFACFKDFKKGLFTSGCDLICKMYPLNMVGVIGAFMELKRQQVKVNVIRCCLPISLQNLNRGDEDRPFVSSNIANKAHIDQALARQLFHKRQPTTE